MLFRSASLSVLRPAVLLLACLLPVAPLLAQPRIEVQVSGVDGDLLKNVRAHLGLSEYVSNGGGFPLSGLLKKKTEPRPLPGEREIRALHRRAPDDIRAALQPYGYYEPEIEASLQQEGELWIAGYQVDPGRPVLIRDIDIQLAGAGAGDAGIEQARGRSKLQPGARLLHSLYEETRTALIKAALAAGYLDARYARSELRVTPAQQRADIVLHLDTGERYFFGPVTIEQEVLDPGFVARYVDLHQGEPFDTERLLQLQLALGDSGYFDRVEVDVRRAEATHRQIPVVIHTTPAPRVRYSAGVGFATDTGPRLTLGADYHRLNRRGHSLSSDLRVSPVEQRLGVQYKVPIRNLLTDKLIYSASQENSEVADNGDSRRTRLGISQNVSWGKYRRRLYVDYLHESFTLGNDDEVVNFFIPGANLSRLHADNVLFPRRGYSWNVDLRGSPGVISSTRYVRAEAGLRGVYPLGSKGRLIARTMLGAISVDDFGLLPTSERFFAGGDQSVRGYDYQELAPVDSSGDTVGGQYLATGSLEADYLFVGNYGAAVFFDAGNADDTMLPELKTSAGIGFRWLTPVGMLRVDLAHPFDADDNFRLHISIGPEL
jgi:translocation and assembly module TamA